MAQSRIVGNSSIDELPTIAVNRRLTWNCVVIPEWQTYSPTYYVAPWTCVSAVPLWRMGDSCVHHARVWENGQQEAVARL
jgi:hypothetical protein